MVDILVKSKYCKSCEFWQKKSDTDEYKEWAEIHKDECQANHEGSAGKMEVDAAIEMFQRSESLHALKYANYVEDGDFKTFKGIVESQPYENFTVKKKECIDHVDYCIMRLMQNLGMTIGPNCFNFCMETDKRRIKYSERSLTDTAKKA